MQFAQTGISKLKSTAALLVHLVVESGQPYWNDQRLKSTRASRLRLHVFINSFVILFLELALIRWIPANVRLLGYFINFILLAVFLGIGIGVLSGRRPGFWAPPFALVLLALVIVVTTSRVEMMLPAMQVLYYGGDKAVQSDQIYLLPVFILLVALTFIPLARSVGRLLTALPPLQGYAFDILGSLAGIAAFSLMSLVNLNPTAWFGLAAVGALLVTPRRVWVLALPLLVGAVVVVFIAGIGSIWSPYYRLTVFPNNNGGYVVNVNNTQHQATTPYLKKETFYFRVYDLFANKKFNHVLVIGAGTGSDVQIALASGAQSVDAVEIDPQIYQLGREIHPDHPYADPRVTVTIQDGRIFLRNTKKTYDLIIYALPDSLTLTSAYSSLRLESFLLTSDSIRESLRRLSPGGLVVLYNYYRDDWLIKKLAGMVEEASGTPPFVTSYGATGKAAVVMAGPGLRDLPTELNIPYRETGLAVTSGRGWQMPVVGQGYLSSDLHQPLATDDWPFIYLREKSVPGLYLVGLVMVLGVVALLLPLTVGARSLVRRFDWHFFFLGAAFMLLETRSLVTFALLFGSTWVVNSLVFFAVLSSVLLAILFNARFKIQRTGPLYLLLFVAVLANLLVPMQNLLNIQSPGLRYSLASLLAFAPIFLANIVFSRSFRDTEMADIAFGSNLLGSMAGGICEYLALISGYQSLLILVLLFYAVAYLAWRRIQAGERKYQKVKVSVKGVERAEPGPG